MLSPRLLAPGSWIGALSWAERDWLQSAFDASCGAEAEEFRDPHKPFT